MKTNLVFLCLAAIAAGLPARGQTNQYPFQNPALPLEARVDNILTLMTLDEKVEFFSSSPSVPRLGIRPMGQVEGAARPGARGTEQLGPA
jgi:beta-glucosidase